MKLSGMSKSSLIVVLLLSIFVGGCVKEDSPAPGCVEFWGPAPMGGCFGKTVILDLKVEPEIDCLTVEVNNCNGGVLNVVNDCSAPLVLGGVEIEPSDGLVSLDVLEKDDGQYLLTYTGGNFALYTPQEDERIEVEGILDGQRVKVSFTKTKELC
jgi:hypothetical protein